MEEWIKAGEAARVVIREFLVVKKGVVAHEPGGGMWCGLGFRRMCVRCWTARVGSIVERLASLWRCCDCSHHIEHGKALLRGLQHINNKSAST